ncbi:MAG: hypothetical protein HY059_11020 [Proteobacteria bacterium]|nr:hypothetical protein [Pseudomonadota bacterium]
MLFTAYFDEADTHGPAPTIIMSAFLGDARQWVIFERKLKRIQKRYGFKIFHAKDFKAKAGEFSGWPDEKCQELVYALSDMVRETLTEGITVSLENERYIKEYREPPSPKGFPLESQYGLCFRACLTHLLDWMAAEKTRHRLHIVVEDGHRNVGAVRVIFNDFKDQLQKAGIDLFGDLVIARKPERLPLMLADFLASTHSMMKASADAGKIDYAKIVDEPKPGKAGLTFLEFKPGSLEKLKSDFEDNKKRKIEEWRSARESRKAASSSSGQQPS